jgi:hypothetical protein
MFRSPVSRQPAQAGQAGVNDVEPGRLGKRLQTLTSRRNFSRGGDAFALGSLANAEATLRAGTVHLPSLPNRLRGRPPFNWLNGRFSRLSQQSALSGSMPIQRHDL